jgi:hypothetical protein
VNYLGDIFMLRIIRLTYFSLLCLLGRRYFSLFDFEYSEIIFTKETKQMRLNNTNAEDNYFSLINIFSDKNNAESIFVADEDDLKSKVRSLELKVVSLFETNKNDLKTLALVKYLYRRLIYYFNSIHEPYYSGLINQSYLKIIRNNINITYAGPLETMKLYIGDGVANSILATDDRLLQNILYRNRYNRFNIYKSLILRQFLDFSVISNSFKLNKLDRDFYNHISNKRIIVVGPASSYVIDKEVMARIDIIILLNHRGFEKTYSYLKKYADKIPIVSYYSGDRLRMLSSEDIDDINQQVGFSVWSERRLVSKFPNIDLSLEKKARVFRNHDQLISFGRWNFTIYVLIDLLLFQPKSISITGVNLFLETKDKLYSSYYNANKYENNSSIYRHNQYEQFCMFKEFYLNNAINPDKYLKCILELTPLEFTKRLKISLG